MNGQKLKGLIGLATRARQASRGMDACRVMIRSGQCGVLLIDENAGTSTRQKAMDLCRQHGTPAVILPAGLTEEATGRGNMVTAVKKGTFAEQILHLYKEEDGKDGQDGQGSPAAPGTTGGNR
jgi:ribosomal protein L7Ae-like RNA K-turn-binding protein